MFLINFTEKIEKLTKTQLSVAGSLNSLDKKEIFFKFYINLYTKLKQKNKFDI